MIRHFSIMLILLAGLVAFTRNYISSDPYLYDEADYMFAVRQGLLANYSDSHAQSVVAFLRTGLNRGLDPAERRALSEQIRTSGDISFYRHWHGPVYFYWLAACAAGTHADEFRMRAASLLIPAFTVFLVYFGVLWLECGMAAQWAAILSATFYVWSYATLRSSELAPHQLYASCCLVTLILVSKAMQTGSRRLWYAAAAACAIAFCTLELAFTLIATLLLCAWLARRQPAITWRTLGVSALVFTGVVLALWPMGVLKLGFLKGYALMAYLAVARKSAWGQISVGHIWATRLHDSPFEWAMIVVALVLFFRYRQRIAAPFFIYSALALVATLRVNSDAPRYLLVFLPALLVGAGLSIGSFLSRFRPGIALGCILLLCALTAAHTYRQFVLYPNTGFPRARAALALIRSHALDGKTVAVPQVDLPAVHYYFPGVRLHSYTDPSEIGRTGPVDAILDQSDPPHLTVAAP